jgi:hypothetical protein
MLSNFYDVVIPANGDLVPIETHGGDAWLFAFKKLKESFYLLG